MRLIILIVPIALVASARAEPTTRVGVDVDVNTVIERGFSLWANLRSPQLPRWRFAAGGFLTGVPDVFVDLDSENDAEGWSVRPVGALALASWFPRGDGFYAGAYVGWVGIRYRRDSVPDATARIDHLSFEPNAGYQWFVYRGLYLQPWLGVALMVRLRGEATLGGETYHELPIVPLYGLNIGYEQRL